MLASISIQENDPHAVTAVANAESRKTIAVLDELLNQSIHLRDLYRNARWQTADIQYRRLRRLFERHYIEQLQLVDVLTDRIRLLGEARQLFASTFLQSEQAVGARLLSRSSLPDQRCAEFVHHRATG
jgi:DNA-binding ferritin-like protein